MAEFCLECWNKMNVTNDPAEKYIISDELDLCEGCGEWKQVIVRERDKDDLYRGKDLIFPLELLSGIFRGLWRLLLLPFILLKNRKKKK